jgi:hypothetical protein
VTRCGWQAGSDRTNGRNSGASSVQDRYLPLAKKVSRIPVSLAKLRVQVHDIGVNTVVDGEGE